MDEMIEREKRLGEREQKEEHGRGTRRKTCGIAEGIKMEGNGRANRPRKEGDIDRGTMVRVR